MSDTNVPTEQAGGFPPDDANASNAPAPPALPDIFPPEPPPGFPPAVPYPPYPMAPGPYFAPPSVPLSIPLSVPLPPTEVPKPQRTLASWWLRIAFGALTLLALAGAAVGGVVYGAGDWASGAFAAGIAALALAGIYLVIALVRLAPRFAARGSLWIGLSSALVLAALGSTGLVLPVPTHLVQAHYLEALQNWTAAVHEYQLAGERGSGSDDLARVYDEWGDALELKGKYVDAIAKYETVIASYSRATTELTRARVSEARVRYKYGLQLASQHEYDFAIDQFTTVMHQFADTPFASLAAVQIAPAYLGLARQEQADGNCIAAISAYQTLTRTYAQTPEGEQAQAALSAPVDVFGSVVNYPTNVKTTLYLSRRVEGNPAYYFSRDYSTMPDTSGGFTFTNVQPGTYNLAAFTPGAHYSYWYWIYTKPYTPYTVAVGPVCPTQAGVYTYGGGWY